MIWAAAGCGYAALYIAAVLLLNGRPDALLWVGNIFQLLPPLLPIVVVLRRRKEWIGRHRVFWDAIALGAALWLAGQTAWAIHELTLAHRLPMLAWTIVPELCGSAMPLMALVAWPHRGQRPEVSLMTVLDLYVLATVAAFLDWALVIVPALPPSHSALAVQLVSVVTPAVRVAVVAGLLLAARAAAGTPWVRAYQRLAVGSAVSFVVLAMLTLTGNTNYQTGSPFDVGWMLPFFFYAWAAASMPASEPEPWPSIADAGRPSPPFLLFGALAAVPVMGYGSRFLMPLGAPFDRDREIVTSALLVWGLVAAMARNIVERRALRYADRQIRLLAAACEQSDELIVIIRRAEVRYANDAFCRATGYSRGEVETLSALQLLPPDSADLVAETSRTLEARQLVRVTTTMVRKDGTTFSAACTFAPIVDLRRGVTHVVCIVRDLTDEVHLREEMVRAERMAAIGDLVSSVAHELSNPLQSIVGTLDLLTAIRRDPETRADLERACSQADRAANIVRNLLAFVRRSTGPRMLGDLAEIAQAAVASRAPALRSANIELRVDYMPGLPLVLVNREEIHQAVVNLVINAQQSMSVNGRGTLTVATHLSGSDAVLELTDDGPGVPDELAGRIFEPFVKTGEVGAGSGLGLSVSFGIVTAHGGSLELVPLEHSSTGSGRADRLGPGACFRVTLPGAGFAGPPIAH